MQLFTICFCNIFAPKKKNQIKPNQSTKQKKKVKARRAQKKKQKKERISKENKNENVGKEFTDKSL